MQNAPADEGRGVRWSILVGADGFEPPTSCL